MGAETLDNDFFDPDLEHSSQDICEGQDAFDWTGKKYQDEYKKPEEDVGQRKKSGGLASAREEFDAWERAKKGRAFYEGPPPKDNPFYIMKYGDRDRWLEEMERFYRSDKK